MIPLQLLFFSVSILENTKTWLSNFSTRGSIFLVLSSLKSVFKVIAPRVEVS